MILAKAVGLYWDEDLCRWIYDC